MSGSGDYEIRGTIGAGATGTVYLGWQLPLDRPVAIKQLADALAGDAAFLSRFRAEAQVMAGLNHPNCVKVYEFIEEPGRHWLVCEYVDGASIDRVAQMAGRLAPEQALGVVKGALTGLAYAHQVGLIHRDIKPANLIADRDGVSKLADFGLAVSAAATDAGGVPVGTPAYMSPEQALGHTVGVPSDVYSCGATLFELITGRTPYHADGALAMLHKQIHDAVPDPRQVEHRLPDPVGELLMRALAKDPAARQAGAPEFLAELELAAVAAYGEDWERRAGIGSLVAAAAAAAGALGAGGAGALAAGTTPALEAAVAGGAGGAGGAGAVLGASTGGPGFSFLGLGPVPLAIGGAVLMAAVIGGGVFAYSQGLFDQRTPPVAIAFTPTPTFVFSPTPDLSPSTDASASPSSSLSPSPGASPGSGAGSSPTPKKSASPSPTSMAQPVQVTNPDFWAQDCASINSCVTPTSNRPASQTSDLPPPGPFAIYNMGAHHPKFAETFTYSYPGTTGHSVIITITWSGTHTGGGADPGTSYVQLVLNPGQSGTFPQTFGPGSSYFDQSDPNSSGPNGAMRFNISWDDVRGSHNLLSPVMYWYCAC